MQITIDDSLVQRAQDLTGLSDVQSVIEESLRLLIEQRKPVQDVGGCLSRYAHRPALSFEQERDLAWNNVAHETNRP